MIDYSDPVKHQFSSGAPQQVELLIVVEVFKSCPFPFNLVLGSCYVVKALKHLECAGPIKTSSPVYSLFVQLQVLICQRKHPFFFFYTAYTCPYRFTRPNG